MTDSLLSKRQEAELITAIQGRGEIPLKFAYLGKGAYNWDRIARERTEGEGINSSEANLLRKRVDDFLSVLTAGKTVNIIDIGCGNGMPVTPILEELTKKGVVFRYVPLDISQEMIQLATKTIAHKFPGTVIKPLLIDIELGQFAEEMYELKRDGSVNLMLFLGSTLGNHSDLNRVLTNYRDSMTSKDYLVIGVELTNIAKVHNLFPHYENEGVQTLVTFILGDLGVPKTDYEYQVSWDEKDNQIEMRAIFKKDAPMTIADESFTINKGENILLGRSIKFTEYTITKLLSDVGFRTELLTTSEDRGYLLSMIQPTRYSV